MVNNKNNKPSYNEVANYGLSELRLLLIESMTAKWLQDGTINQEQYDIGRPIMNKQWEKFGKKGRDLLRRQSA